MNVQEPQNNLPPAIVETLGKADELRMDGQLDVAISLLKQELESADTGGLMQYKGRISLAMAIAESYVELGETQKALQTLAGEAVFAKATFAEIKATGAEDEKRTAFQGLVQLRDFHTRIALLGRAAPEVAVREWVIGPPTTLADLKGKVTLLEFWATWCKPCEQMFPKLNQLHQAHRGDGLEIVALTRFFMSYGAPEPVQQEELSLIRSFVENHGVEFRVGVSPDEQTQTTFGAIGLPIIVLIDRQSVIRHITVSTEDERLKTALTNCLEEQA